ncbi:phage replisome organizer N-terminal domain-containing protein [Fusobacterium necrophorum]|uniref:Phage replisome organizer N-terminal domain-containing protein n=2 Tax=Fusobacterium necrophorum TaxID=859 RepID=A0AAW6WH79_9FUSO|nr:phage replisome organizer N-terminal domain-containing protein [Fusobacterium necrophorum]KYM57065.1 replication protein [Fusobacterium necrophorum subsp. funduliforme]MDK4475470.1 phage replisome organizer N-terminal domain-containing protein [Fusobacterium necrophorum]MDK4481880.1 phage replisome organizer N-terminal domain-containing protein [Fusobacterium necrophorum]MDK4512994.1 phage replisome organizer N-terminal domain-containing protein [Fusobacterium necrophorum]
MPKRYYWLKLKEDFFEQRVIKKLRKIAGGDTYTIIYLKLQLLAMKNEGKLFFEGVEDNFSSEMALELDESEENVSVTLSYLEKNGLMELVSSDEYFLPQVLDVTGSESASTLRSRKSRELKKALQCNTTATQCNKLQQIGNVEIEKDREIELEIERDMGTMSQHFSKEAMQSYFQYLCHRFKQVNINPQSVLDISIKCQELDLNPLYEIYRSSFLLGDVKGEYEMTLRSFLKLDIYDKMKNGLYRNKQLKAKQGEEFESTALQMLKELKAGGSS